MRRNVKDLRGYAIRATDGVIGKVDDFYFDDEDWGIRYLIVSTSNWVGAEELILPPHWITKVSWPVKQVHVAMTRQAVKDAPHYYSHAQGARPEKRQA